MSNYTDFTIHQWGVVDSKESVMGTLELNMRRVLP